MHEWPGWRSNFADVNLVKDRLSHHQVIRRLMSVVSRLYESATSFPGATVVALMLDRGSRRLDPRRPFETNIPHSSGAKSVQSKDGDILGVDCPSSLVTAILQNVNISCSIRTSVSSLYGTARQSRRVTC